MRACNQRISVGGLDENKSIAMDIDVPQDKSHVNVSDEFANISYTLVPRCVYFDNAEGKWHTEGILRSKFEFDEVTGEALPSGGDMVTHLKWNGSHYVNV